MHIIHGTWIPDDTDAFTQEGCAGYLTHPCNYINF